MAEETPLAIMVTGVAGFIGYHCARALLERGESVVGLDSLTDYYSVALKEARLGELQQHRRFRFARLDVADSETLSSKMAGENIDRVIHFAAQPGVRYALENPQAYITANLVGHANILEFCRRRGDIAHLVYASSSSVYGGNTKLPFSESDRVDHPISLYAATKRADELMSHTYAHLHGLPQTGLRLFTVYGPWGRPDMAVWLFAEAILQGRPIPLFGDGSARRDFTFIDDVVAGVLAVLDAPPRGGPGDAPHRIYNIGNSRSVSVSDLIEVLERAIGRRARTVMLPAQPGDLPETVADIAAIVADHGFAPATPLEVGVPRFVDWYRAHHGERATTAGTRVG
jgi:UDP-glucuronate 4-epimerase